MERKYYDLTNAQQVVLFQCKYTLYKRVVNILSSINVEPNVDWNLMEEAFNLVVERNDCLRLRFEKQGKQVKQYFVEHDKISVPRLNLRNEEEFNSFVLKNRKKAVPFMKGKVFEPFFIQIADGGGYRVYLKVCHLILDMYGINVIYNDLMAVYNALKAGKEMPEQPGSFESLIQKDLKYASNPEINAKNRVYFDNVLNNREIPYYAGVHGDASKVWLKEKKHGSRFKRMELIHCDTVGETFEISKSIVDKAVLWTQKTNETLSSILNYCYAITASAINEYLDNFLILDICNCRGTISEKKSAGTKAQSGPCFIDIDWDKNFNENVKLFSEQHNALYKHIVFSDIEFISMMHKHYDYSVFEMPYSFCYSLVPFSLSDGVRIDFYSNGKSALICYMVQLWDVENNTILVDYDYQNRLISHEAMKSFHELYEKVLNAVIDSPDENLKSVVQRIKK